MKVPGKNRATQRAADTTIIAQPAAAYLVRYHVVFFGRQA